MWVAAVDDLIARGLLGADPSAAGRLGGGERWSRHFRFTSDSEWFERLLERARACLNNPNDPRWLVVRIAGQLSPSPGARTGSREAWRRYPEF